MFLKCRQGGPAKKDTRCSAAHALDRKWAYIASLSRSPLLRSLRERLMASSLHRPQGETFQR
jgi:hypothetical protein